MGHTHPSNFGTMYSFGSIGDRVPIAPIPLSSTRKFSQKHDQCTVFPNQRYYKYVKRRVLVLRAAKNEEQGDDTLTSSRPPLSLSLSIAPKSDDDNGDDDDHSPPKFQPFVANYELKKRMMSFYKEIPLASGHTLVVRPLDESWIEDCAEVLTEAFADAMGYVTIYRNFLRRQIRNYLKQHMNIAPKAVCLVALLVHHDSCGGGGGQVQQGTTEGRQDRCLSTTTTARTDRISYCDHEGTEGMYVDSGFYSDLNFEQTGRNQTYMEMASDGDGMACVGVGIQIPLPEEGNIEKNGPCALVGVVEISFTASTRHQDLTGLDPPPERPYLCNMAVASTARRQGIGALILQAAEELIVNVGEDVVYLHLRFKDAPAAALYNKAGFEIEKQDSIFVRLLGQDRRWLMRKNLVKENKNFTRSTNSSSTLM